MTHKKHLGVEISRCFFVEIAQKCEQNFIPNFFQKTEITLEKIVKVFYN